LFQQISVLLAPITTTRAYEVAPGSTISTGAMAYYGSISKNHLLEERPIFFGWNNFSENAGSSGEAYHD